MIHSFCIASMGQLGLETNLEGGLQKYKDVGRIILLSVMGLYYIPSNIES